MASAILSRESFNDAVEKALEALKDISIESLTKYQSKALFHVLNGEDTFVSLPTGHGKSLICQLAPSVSKHLGLLSEVLIVLVISPLNALIDDQIASVTKLGITACKVDASSLEDTVSLAGHEVRESETDGQTPAAASYYRHVTQKFHGNRIFISRMLNRNPKRLSAGLFLGTETTKTKREQPKPRREWQYNAEKHKGKASASRVEACVQEIDTWMLLNKLKLNREKTELLLISSLHRARPPLLHLDVCDESADFTKSRQHWSYFRRIFEYGSSGDSNV